jgi:hypothetical protein
MRAVSLVGAVTHNEGSATGATVAATRNGILEGSHIVVLVTVEDLTTVAQVSDGTRIITVPDASFDWAAGTQRMVAYSFPNHAGGNFTFTATFGATQTFRGIYIIELTGTAGCTASANNQGSGTVMSVASPPLPLDGCYVLAIAFAAGALTLTSGGWTDLVNDAAVLVDDVAGLAQASRGVATATWSSATGAWGAFLVAYGPIQDPTPSIGMNQRAA